MQDLIAIVPEEETEFRERLEEIGSFNGKAIVGAFMEFYGIHVYPRGTWENDFMGKFAELVAAENSSES